MGQVIINGQVYTIFEMVPTMVSSAGLIKEELERKEKYRRERDWKQMARQNYRKR